MSNLSDMIWIEMRKAIRSRMPLWTALGSLFLPLGIAFLIIIAKNPAIFEKMGLLNAKANLVTYASIDWPSYMVTYGQTIAAAGFILYMLIISWTFGREFVDGTLKDILAVPIQRSSIMLAKFIAVALWSAGLTMVILITGLVMGFLINLPGGAIAAIVPGCVHVILTACMIFVVSTPFALLASIGRGYLLPVGISFLVLITANLAILIGMGEYFPWSVPGVYAQGNNSLAPASYWIVFLTGLAGIIATYLWWKYADQNR